MTNPEAAPKYGKFSIAEGREIRGELRLAGESTSLYLQDDAFFSTYDLPDGCVTGTLNDLTRVTLLGCLTTEGSGSASCDREEYHFAKLSPHFVLEGRRHLRPGDAVISQVTFVIGDAAALFYDFDAFGIMLDATPHIEGIANANQLHRPAPIGPGPKIAYFAGRHTIVEAHTVLGTVRAQHNPSVGRIGGPEGVRIDNVISVSIEPDSPITFDEATARTVRLLRFLELVIGRPQEMRDLIVDVNDGRQRDRLRVHWTHAPSPEAKSTDRHSSPHPADVLLDPINRPEEFAGVMRAWLAADEERRDARGRFHTSFAHQRYSIERLIGAANMFDILPSSAVPKDVQISADVIEAKRRCEEIFRALPDSDERSSVLSALGRVGKASLKHKVRHRARLVLEAVGGRFLDLELVVSQAVDCRNHYVHGTPTKIDYAEHSDIVSFFTETLEFVFGAAELLEAGWDIRAFITKGTTMSHPFGTYFVEYETAVRTLKALLSSRALAEV